MFKPLSGILLCEVASPLSGFSTAGTATDSWHDSPAERLDRQSVRTTTEIRRHEIYTPATATAEKFAGLIGKDGNLNPLSTIALSLPGMARCCVEATCVLSVAKQQREEQVTVETAIPPPGFRRALFGLVGCLACQ